MLEMIESLATVVVLVPVMVAVLLGAIYGLGEVFNVFSAIGRKNNNG
nr:AcrZ family multidrug efflux pump-associated protein [Serratia marcescens]WJH98719.1 AcrZ family multidrug efflux pump-associated protein [Serratia marcescens]